MNPNTLPNSSLLLSLPAILWCFGVSHVVVGQTPIKNPAVMVSDASVYIGFSTYSPLNNSLENFRVLAPDSEILKGDYSNFQLSDGYSINSSSVFTALIGLTFRDAEGIGRRANPQVRLGFTFVDQGSIGLDLNRTTRVPFDTLVSSQTGNSIFIDSVFTESVFVDYQATQLQLDASIIWRTNTESRWSLYGGVGLRAGMGINTFTTVSTLSDNYISGDENLYAYERDFSNFRTERIANDNGFSSAIYLPFGLDFRLGNNGFWKQTHLVSEFRPAIGTQSIPELETVVSPSFAMNFGVRVAW